MAKHSDAQISTEGTEVSQSPAPTQASINPMVYATAVTPLSGESNRSPATLVEPEQPIRADGSGVGEQTEPPTAIEELPLARLCRRCNRRVFTHGSHCPKPCGGFLEGNADAMTHGKRSKKALRQRRLELLEGLRAKYRQPDGTVHPQVDALLSEQAKAQAVSDQATEYREECALSVSDPKQQRAIKTFMDAAATIARISAVLMTLPEAVMPPSRPSRVTFGGRYLPQNPDAPALRIIREDSEPDMPPNRLLHIQPADGRALVLDAVTTRAEILEELSDRDDEDHPGVRGAETAEAVTEGEVVQTVEVGTISQVGQSTAGVRAAADAQVFVFRLDEARCDPELLRIGLAVTFRRGPAAQANEIDVWREPAASESHSGVAAAGKQGIPAAGASPGLPFAGRGNVF
jgi:hypothetical protein